MPTLIGWAGAGSILNRQAWILFAVLFLWQFPHFLAIALMYREDYSRAGYRMLPSFDRDSRFTRAEVLVFTLALILITSLPLTGPVVQIYLHGMLLPCTIDPESMRAAALIVRSCAARFNGGAYEWSGKNADIACQSGNSQPDRHRNRMV